jgi:hypothetical protein
MRELGGCVTSKVERKRGAEETAVAAVLGLRTTTR